MMNMGCRLARNRLSTALMILGMSLLIAACGSDGGDNMTRVEAPADGGEMPPDMVTDLGDWNTLMPGAALDISDTNDVLRAYYDSSGDGHVAAAAPVQPAGTGTATWNGRWSGKVADTDGWMSYGVTKEELQQLGGDAHITVYFDNAGVEAQLVYEDIGLADSSRTGVSIGLDELTFDRVSVTDGMFEPATTYMHSYVSDQVEVNVTGAFRGEGAFGGTDAEGVVGHVGGPLSLEYGRGPRGLGTFQSVFYGTKDEN